MRNWRLDYLRLKHVGLSIMAEIRYFSARENSAAQCELISNKKLILVYIIWGWKVPPTVTNEYS